MKFPEQGATSESDYDPPNLSLASTLFCATLTEAPIHSPESAQRQLELAATTETLTI